MAEQFTGFNKVYLIVHPFFAMENARVKGEASSLRNVTPIDVFSDYLEMNTVNGWRRMLKKASKEPSSVVVIIGPQELENQTPRRFFFKGELTKQKLASFSKEYQQFLHEAKRVAGKKLFYLSHSAPTGKYVGHLLKTMIGRRMVPTRDVLVIGAGEYLGTKENPQCVNDNIEVFKKAIEKIQKMVWKTQPTRTRAGIRLKVRVDGKKARVSLNHQDFGLAEIVREMKKNGKVTPEFLTKRIKHQQSDPKSIQEMANHYNQMWEKHGHTRR